MQEISCEIGPPAHQTQIGDRRSSCAPTRAYCRQCRDAIYLLIAVVDKPVDDLVDFVDCESAFCQPESPIRLAMVLGPPETLIHNLPDNQWRGCVSTPCAEILTYARAAERVELSVWNDVDRIWGG